MTRGWTEGKPWEMAWGELRWEGTDGSNDWADGGETVGNSMGRAPWGRSEMEATRGWPGGKPWEIAWGELQGEGAIRKRRQGNHLQWEEAGVITVTNASFSNEKNFQSQQGRIHFLGDLTEIKDDKNTTYRVLPLSFGSTTIKRVCRSTLQAETYALQNGLETGNTLRGVIAELKGQIRSLKSWEEDARICIPHLAMTDCRSLSHHLNQEVLAKVSDKCLGIELQGIHENLWIDGPMDRWAPLMEQMPEWRGQVDLDRDKYHGLGLSDQIHATGSPTSSAERVPLRCTDVFFLRLRFRP